MCTLLLSQFQLLIYDFSQNNQETYEEVVFSLEKGENFFGSSPTVVTVKYGEIVKIFKAPKKNLTENLVLWNEVLRSVNTNPHFFFFFFEFMLTFSLTLKIPLFAPSINTSTLFHKNWSKYSLWSYNSITIYTRFL